MGTTLLRIVPIHSKQPKPFLVPDYGYYGRLYQFLRIDFCPSLSNFDCYTKAQIVVRSTFRIVFADEASVSFHISFLADSFVTTSISRFDAFDAVHFANLAEAISLVPDFLNLERTSGFLPDD